MNGVGPITVGWLLGHRKRRTTAIYAHLDDAARQDAAAQAAAVIAGAMGYRTAPPPCRTRRTATGMAPRRTRPRPGMRKPHSHRRPAARSGRSTAY